MKESNEIIIEVNNCSERDSLLSILAHRGYEVSVKYDDSKWPEGHHYVIAHKIL